MANKLRVHKSTISRELKRKRNGTTKNDNKHHHLSKTLGYEAQNAHLQMQERRAKAAKKSLTVEVIERVVYLIKRCRASRPPG